MIKLFNSLSKSRRQDFIVITLGMGLILLSKYLA